MPEHDSKPPPLDYASPPEKKPADSMWRYLEHYLALVGLIIVTGFFSLIMLALGIFAAIAWITAGPNLRLNMHEVRIACYVDTPIGLASAGVCVLAYRKLQE